MPVIELAPPMDGAASISKHEGAKCAARGSATLLATGTSASTRLAPPMDGATSKHEGAKCATRGSIAPNEQLIN